MTSYPSAMYDAYGRLRLDFSATEVQAWLEQQQQRLETILVRRQELMARDTERRAYEEEVLWRRQNARR